MVTAAMLLRNMPEPSNLKAHWARDEIRGLLETAAMQQAESSASRRRGLASEQPAEPSRQEREASVYPKHAQRNKAVYVTEPTNYMRLSKKIIHQADDLTNLSPYNPVVREITTDFKPTYIPAKIVISSAVAITSYIKVCVTNNRSLNIVIINQF
jgi:hypothetical protein